MTNSSFSNKVAGQPYYHPWADMAFLFGQKLSSFQKHESRRAEPGCPRLSASVLEPWSRQPCGPLTRRPRAPR